MCWEEEIKTHTACAEIGEPVRYCQECFLCGATQFRLHDCRPRTFRQLVGRCVNMVRSWIARWQCKACQQRFTDYPPFALPRKQFVQPAVHSLAKKYLGSNASYRRTVREQGLPLVYDPSPAQRDPAPELAPSTLWRWLSWLGGMSNTLRAASDLLRQQEPNSQWHRQVWEPGSGKFRSPQRKETLQQAMKLLVLSELLGTLGSGLDL